MPDFLPEVRLDVEYFVDKMVEMGAQSIDFMCKSAFGNCLYPSTVGRSNRAIKGDGDIFGNLCRRAKSRGLEVIAYYDMLLNDEIGCEHPEWLQVDREGQPLLFESYKMFCMNSPYRGHVFEHLKEIASSFEIDGFNLDLQYFHPRGCFCQWCKEKWLDFYKFQRHSRQEFILSAMAEAEVVRTGLIWIWNDNTDVDLNAHATLLGAEAHPPGYFECVTDAKWMQSSGKPFEFWMPESIS